MNAALVCTLYLSELCICNVKVHAFFTSWILWKGICRIRLRYRLYLTANIGLLALQAILIILHSLLFNFSFLLFRFLKMQWQHLNINTSSDLLSKSDGLCWTLRGLRVSSQCLFKCPQIKLFCSCTQCTL